MAYITTWYHTNLPKDIVDILERDLTQFDSEVDEAKLHGDQVDHIIRDSKTAWIPTSHWIGGFLWHYIQRINRENYCYDLTGIDGETIQYTQYGTGQFYNWHIDGNIDTAYKPNLIVGSGVNISNDLITLEGEYVRKLSFSLQLSDPEDYTGGEVQLLDQGRKTYFAPKQKGTLIMFDSRTSHRVRKVKSGMRKSLVGWVVGPRWK